MTQQDIHGPSPVGISMYRWEKAVFWGMLAVSVVLLAVRVWGVA